MMMMNGTGLMVNQQEQHHQQQLLMEAAAENMSNLTSAASGDQASVSCSSIMGSIFAHPTLPNSTAEHQHQVVHHQQYFAPQQQQQDEAQLLHHHPPPPLSQQPPAKKKRSLPGNPDPKAEVIALSPKTLLATNRFVCEICNKGFQRDQNLQLHRRGHNLPWKLKQRSSKEVRKKVYVCPETSCVHHDPSRALGDLTGIKKHFCRKHGEKKWKCEKCSKRYAVQSDWKAHSKTCGTREYRCDCGTLFSRRDSFITHRAFCDALAEETARAITTTSLLTPGLGAIGSPTSHHHHLLNLQSPSAAPQFSLHHPFSLKREQQNFNLPPWLCCPQPPQQQQQQQHPPSMMPPSGGGNGSSPQHTINHHHHQLPPSTSSIFSRELFQAPHDHNQHHHHQTQSPNPNSNHGPTTMSSPASGNANASSYPSAPHMSATALLQKAAQIGATMSNNKTHVSAVPTGTTTNNDDKASNNNTTTNSNNTTSGGSGLFGLNLSSRDDTQLAATGFFGTHNHYLTSASSTASSVAPAAGGGSTVSFLHDMMMSAVGFDQNPSFDEDTFGGGSMAGGAFDFQQAYFKAAAGGSLGGARVASGTSTLSVQGPNAAGGRKDDGLTRDFLGLRPLSRNDILNITGFDSCMSSSTTTTTNTATAATNATESRDHDQQNKSWQSQLDSSC